MKYEIMTRSIPTDSIPETHARLMDIMNKMQKPWGFGENGGPPAPGCGSGLLAESKLFKYLGPGVRGSIVYNYRGYNRDESVCDDFIRLEFNPAKQDYARMLKTILPRYITAFSAYLAEVGDVEWGLADWDEQKKLASNARYNVYRIYPVHYFGNLLCQRAFKKTPTAMIKLLSGECEHVELFNGGVYMIATCRIIELKEANQINERLWKVLKVDKQ